MLLIQHRIFLGAILFITCLLILLGFSPSIFKNINSLKSLATINLLSSTNNSLYDQCTHHSCFNVHYCALEVAGIKPHQLRVFVYPEALFLNANKALGYFGGRLFQKTIEAIKSTRYAVSSPESACLYVASMNFQNESGILPPDLLNMLMSFPW